jgi:(p)ppGpp synthase/HD superfamily hydrolase
VSRPPRYSRLLDDALGFAADQFREKARKGTEVPYLTHLLQVMVTVAEHGGDEEQMIAALLHDYLEDIEGSDRRIVAERYGERVARLVEALSDTTVRPKPPWPERKQKYLDALAAEPHDVKLVSAADKLHNARCILRDHRTLGDALWKRFTASREETLWYYRRAVEALATGWEHPIVDELREVVDALHRAVEDAPVSGRPGS